jgi:hypothetical protein
MSSARSSTSKSSLSVACLAPDGLNIPPSSDLLSVAEVDRTDAFFAAADAIGVLPRIANRGIRGARPDAGSGKRQLQPQLLRNFQRHVPNSSGHGTVVGRLASI